MNILVYGSPLCVIIYISYKLLEIVFWTTLYIKFGKFIFTQSKNT